MKESKKYRGHGLLDGNNPKTLNQIKHTSNNWFIKHCSGKNREMEHMVRLILGHAPIGAYRTRFNLPGPTSCWYCWYDGEKQALETQDHILYECKGWDRGYHVKEIHIEGHPKYNRDIPKYRLKHDHKIWEMHTLAREASGNQQDIDEIYDLHGDTNFRKKILGTDWKNFGHTVRLNPMVRTFEWSDLVEKAFEDANNSLDYTISVHIWKALMHTRKRREYREEYIEQLEIQCANKYAKETKEFNHKQMRRKDYRDPTRWHQSFPSPDILERKFNQWYAKYVVARYCIFFNYDESLSEEEEEALAKEFGYRGKYNPVGRFSDMVPKDDEVLPADEDDRGNQVDEAHR